MDLSEFKKLPKDKQKEYYKILKKKKENHQAQMIFRAESDVQINTKLWNKQLQYLLRLYPEPDTFWKFIRYITFKLNVVREQEEERWKLDTEYCQKSLEELEALKAEKFETLKAVMPKIPIYSTRKRPSKFFNKEGIPTKKAVEYVSLCRDIGIDISDGVIEADKLPLSIDIKTGEDNPNPSSSKQLKDWLFSQGWQPQTFKFVDGREIPQISLPFGGGICPSVQDLYDIEPNLKSLEGYSVASHRIGILKGFLRDQKDGYLKAGISGFTNTLRSKHREVVNLPKVNTLYGEPIRRSLIADDGYDLCGSDLSGLEDRIKQHFIYEYDPEYVNEMNVPGFDPHLRLAVFSGKMTQAESDAYKAGDKTTNKKTRDTFKTLNYAAAYGAGAAKLAQSGNMDIGEAKQLHKAYWKLNWSIKKLAEDQTVININRQDWIFNPVNQFWYSLRSEKDRVNTLIQSTGSYVFDLWTGYLRHYGIKIKASFHDEVIFHVPEGIHVFEDKRWRGKYVDICKQAIQDVNETLKLNRELDCDVQIGKYYSEIH